MMTTVYELVQFAMLGAERLGDVMAYEVFRAMMANLTLEEAVQPAACYGII